MDYEKMKQRREQLSLARPVLVTLLFWAPRETSLARISELEEIYRIWLGLAALGPQAADSTLLARHYALKALARF